MQPTKLTGRTRTAWRATTPGLWAVLLLLTLGAAPAHAAEAGAAPALVWGIPFAGVLLSVALLPVLAPKLWHHRMGAVMALWTLALLAAEAATQGVGVAAHTVWHAALLEYLPFVILLLALFTAGGGILLEGGPWGRPGGNTLLLALGTVFAGVMGTTGVSMVLIQPLLRANAHRRRRAHLVVFFILLVANVGGATSPLGDPPLYLGFLQGVPFIWPFLHLSLPMLTVALPLLGAFYLVDRHLAARDHEAGPRRPLRLRGVANVWLVGVVVAAVLVQGVWDPGDVVLWGVPIGMDRLAGMTAMLAVVAASLALTPKSVREGNMFHWEPMAEVGKLFAAIFITITPVLAMLAAGFDGPFAGVLRLVTRADGTPEPVAYFWLTGLLSGFLDNAPTYLVFFQMAGDDPVRLTGELSTTLVAISAGAVFFGALTYVGNAPNLMVRSIAAHRGIRMPGFFGYMMWSSLLLVPCFVLVSFLFLL
jgi:Na+/H+ antiporter NhaD/arsenite permease-like protein